MLIRTPKGNCTKQTQPSGLTRLVRFEPSKNFGIINSITKLHLVGISA
jgi:hypothetical protein